MKNLTLLFCLFTIIIQGQNISISQLSLLRSKNLAEIEEVLSNKNWTYISGEEEGENSLGYALFVYQKSEYSNRGQGFIYFYYSSNLKKNRLELQVFKKNIYDQYIQELKKIGCKLISSKMENGNIVKFYQGKTTTIRVNIDIEKKYDNTETYYSFFIMSNDDYFRNYYEN